MRSWRWAVAVAFGFAIVGTSCTPRPADGGVQLQSAVAKPPLQESNARFATAESTGIPDGYPLRKWVGPMRSSEVDNVETTVADGQDCKLFRGIHFDLATSGNFFLVDDPCVVFDHVSFTTDSKISNTSAMLQQAEDSIRLLVLSSEFDGGPHHQRGIQADFGITVRRSRFTRFGNAAVEMNDPTASRTFEATGNYLYEPGGWDRDDHVDGLQVGGGGRVSITGNTVEIEPYGSTPHQEEYISNAALGLWAESGDIEGPVTIANNRLAGGGSILYLEAKASYRFIGKVSVVDNVIDQRFEPSGGIFGILADNNVPDRLEWRSNVFSDGRTVTLAEALVGG